MDAENQGCTQGLADVKAGWHLHFSFCHCCISLYTSLCIHACIHTSFNILFQYIYIDHIGPGSEDRRKFQRLPMSVVSRASGCKGSIFGVIGVRVMFLEATDDRAADGQLVGWSAGRVCFSLHNLSFCKGRNGYRWQLIIHKWSQGLVREALSLTSQPQAGYRN